MCRQAGSAVIKNNKQLVIDTNYSKLQFFPILLVEKVAIYYSKRSAAMNLERCAVDIFVICNTKMSEKI